MNNIKQNIADNQLGNNIDRRRSSIIRHLVVESDL